MTSDKLNTLTVAQLHKALKGLCNGSIGFDPFRDDRTNTKSKIIDYLLSTYSHDELEIVIKYTGKDDADHEPSITSDLNDAGKQIAAILQSVAGKSPMDEDKVRSIVGAELFEYESTMRDIVDQQIAKISLPITVEVKNSQGEVKSCGVQHKAFPNLLKACNARSRDCF